MVYKLNSLTAIVNEFESHHGPFLAQNRKKETK